jgi:glutamine synthetase
MSQTPKAGLRYYGYEDEEDVLATVSDRRNHIEFIRVIFPDILGRHMEFTIPFYELEKAFQEGKGFDGSSVEGFVRIEESDLLIRPEAQTFRVLPWEYAGFNDETQWREAIMFGDILLPEGSPFEGDSRYILKKTLARSQKEFGIDDFMVGPELEFFLFPDKDNAVPLDEGGYFFNGKHGEIRKEIQLLLRKIGILAEYDHHEVAHGQHEIDLRFHSALEMADVCMIFRYLVKKVARMHHLYATFMPKPLNGQNGSGMHVHQSLWQGKKNLFFEKDGPYHLSEMARQYVAGLMSHSGEIAAVFCQWVNSFKRLIEGYEAPVYIAWGQRNRSAYVRVPEYQPGKEQATRIELRSPDPSCNLYLAFATMLAAGLEGVRNSYELTDPVEENIYEMSNARQKKLAIKTLPRNLEQALKIMTKSELLNKTLGDHVFHTFIVNKEWEIQKYAQNVPGKFDDQVSDYEIKEYLPVL